MSINFKQPKYIMPLIALPFLFLFFYVYQTTKAEAKPVIKQQEGMQDQIGSVSSEVQKKGLEDKLQAFSEQYKEADGNTAVNAIDAETPPGYGQEKRVLDSIDREMKRKFSQGNTLPYASGYSLQQQGIGRLSKEDQALADALAGLSQRQQIPASSPPIRPAKEKDPMDLFKAQMAYMDSISKASDPEYKAEMQRKDLMNKAEALRKQQPKLEVQKEENYSSVFNTLKAEKKQPYITAIIDENITGYSGSRLRLRLLEDIRAGNTQVKKGSYLYAVVSGFGDQRVNLTVQSIFYENKILPVKLDIYDADGLPGLYVPESAFREFTKDLGGGSMQGVNMQGGSGSQFLMSSLDKVFQSTSSAIASWIRKNKAKIKYNSYIYLIDPEALQNAQKSY